jgi:hypothetical protein
MCGKLLTIASMIAFVIAKPVEHNLLDHELMDLNAVDLVQMANILMTPNIPKSGQHIVKVGDHVSDVSEKLKHGAKRISHFIDTQKEAKLVSAFVPFEVSSKSGAIGGAIPAMAAMKGSIIGSAIATPIIIKSIALPGLAAAKTAAILSVPAIVTHRVKSNTTHNLFSKESTHNLFSKESAHNMFSKGTNVLKKGAFGAIGLAAKGAAVVKTKAVVAGKLMLRPIAIITGAKLKFLGTGLTLAGKGVSLTGAGIKKVGTGLKLGGLGAVGIGATAIGWGLDKTTIDHHLKEGHKFTKS